MRLEGPSLIAPRGRVGLKRRPLGANPRGLTQNEKMEMAACSADETQCQNRNAPTATKTVSRIS